MAVPSQLVLQRELAPVRVQPANTASFGDEVSIVELLWRRRWVLVACVAVSLMLGVAYLKLATPLYTSTARVYVQTSEHAAAPTPGSSAYADATAAAHAELLQSATVLKEVLADPRIMETQALAGQERPLSKLRRMLEVQAGEKERIVSVSITTPDADESAMIVNRVVEAYVDRQRQQRQATAAAALERLRARIGSAAVDAAVELPEQGVQLTQDPQVVAQRLQELGQRLTDAELATVQAQSLAEAAAKTTDFASLQQLLAAAGIETPRESLTLQTELTALLAAVEQERERLSRLGPSHPSVEALDRQAAAVRRRITEWDDSTLTSLRLRLREHVSSLVRREVYVRAALEAQQRVAASLDSVPVVLIDPAYAAEKPSSPDVKRVLGMSLVLGLVLGGTIVLWLDYRDHTTAVRAALPRATLENADDVDLAMPETPLLGVVPETRAISDETPAWDATASSIHHVRAVLQVRARNMGHKTFAITSPRRGAGKTSVAVGLASSLALSGTKTLVVDCDLASRMSSQTGGVPLDRVMQGKGYVGEGESKDMRLSRMFGVAAMIDGLPLEQCLAPSSVANLSVMPAGLVQPDHVARMSDRFIRRLLEEASRSYDMVLIDTGPVPGSVEALLVCSRVDGVLVVAQHGEERRQFDKTVSYLRVLGAKLAGTIFNRYGGAAEVSPEPAGFIPYARQREPKADGQLGSGLLAATVLNGNGHHANGTAIDDNDITASDLGDLVDVLNDGRGTTAADRK